MRGDGALIANDDWHGDDEGFRAFLASAFKAAMGVTAPDIEHMTKAELRAALEEVWSDKAATTVARCEKPARSEQHPTMKPVRLMAYLMANSTEPGQTVLDPFCGSGTTLVAAEQLGRTCWAMELDPRYCDVILERWERLTGRTAVRED